LEHCTRRGGFPFSQFIQTSTTGDFGVHDEGALFNDLLAELGENRDMPGGWVNVTAVADRGSTLSLITLTLMALGLVARRFQRATG